MGEEPKTIARVCEIRKETSKTIHATTRIVLLKHTQVIPEIHHEVKYITPIQNTV